MKKKRNLIIISSIILVATTIATTIAFISKDNTIDNDFLLGTVSTAVDETFTNNVKEDVSIENTGNVDAYIRAFILISYKDANGVILTDTPAANTDYSMTMSNSTNWLYSSTDGFYYYKLPVAPNNNTDILIDECRELQSHNGKILSVDIITQSIQATPSSAVTEAWGVTIANNILSLS